MASQSTRSSSTNSALKELTSNKLALLCNTLNPVAPKCYALGLQLGVRKENIEIIMTNIPNNCQAQLREIISERLKQDSPLTWHDIVTVLRSPLVHHPDLARQIESLYISPTSYLQEHLTSDPQLHPPSDPRHENTESFSNSTAQTHTPLVPPSSADSMGTVRPLQPQLPKQCPSQPIQPVNTGMYTPSPSHPYFQCYPHYQPPLPHFQIHPDAMVASQSSLQCTQPGSVYPSSSVPSHTIPHVQFPTTQPGWVTHFGYPPLYPHLYQAAYPNTPPIPHRYPTTPHILPPTTRPLQEGVGGQWDSESYMYHAQPETSHTQSQSSSIESCPSVKGQHLKSNPDLPSTRSSSYSHSAQSAYHRSPMDTYVHYIKDCYKQCEIETDPNVLKWPPTPSKIFINLACIDWESVVSKEEADEYTRTMVEDGNVDVIMKEKRNIDFDDIVRDLPPTTALEKVVLVEGAPGVGKSTFAWEFCRRWERGEIAQQYQLVLLLKLRDDRMSRAKNLQDLIYHPDADVSNDVKRDLVHSHGVNTLIILEGFDELPDSQRKGSSIFLQLILGQLLMHATVMITSRHWATGEIMRRIEHRVFQHIDVLGFTEENIVEYVKSVFREKKTVSTIDQSVRGTDEVSDKAKKNVDDVITYLHTYPQIKACMYIPLNAAIVVSIHQESKKGKCILPKTLTELYYALTQILLLRYLYGHPDYSEQKWNIDSLNKDLPDKVYKQMLTICKVAYDGVCTKGRKRVQLIFSDRDLDGCETLGFMQSVAEVYVKQGQKISHNFLHLTFQEFLAAFFISTMSLEDQLEHFQKHKDGRLRVVLRFLAGLTKLNKVTPDHLKSLLGELTEELSDEQHSPYYNTGVVYVNAHHTNWLFEAQNSELVKSLFHNRTADFVFSKGMLPLEYYSVGYCIAHSHSKWSLTFLPDIEENKLHMFVNGAKTGDDHYRIELNLTSKHIAPEKMCILVNGLSSCVEKLYYFLELQSLPPSLPPLSELYTLELQIDKNESAFNISCNLPSSSPKALIINSSCKGTTLGARTCEAVGKLLSSTKSLKEFHLSPKIKNHIFSTHVSENGMEVISRGLSDNIAVPLKSLDIDCKCTFTATRSLAQFLTRSTTLQYFKIHVNAFEDVDVFAKGLSNDIALPLQRLDIECKCTFTTTATRSLAQFLTKSTTMKYFKLHVNTFEDIDVFAKGLSDNKALPLKSLNIDCKCTFTTTATRSLAQFLTKSTTLEYFIIHVNTFEDVDVFVKGLSDNIALPLKRVDIDSYSKCKFTTTATSYLVQFITRSTTLECIRICNVTFTAQGLIDLTEAMHRCSRLQEKKLEQLLFCVECPDDVVNLRDMINTHSDMKKSLTDWDGVTDVLSSPIRLDDKRKASLLSLGLGYCQDISLTLMNMSIISDGGAVALAQALHHNSTLKELNLSGNNAIGREGTHQLVQALTVNTSITIDTYYDGLVLPRRCEEYVTQCTHFTTVKGRIRFW